MRPTIQLGRCSAEEDLDVTCRTLDSAKVPQASYLTGHSRKLCSFVDTSEQGIARAAFSVVQEDDERAPCALHSFHAPDWSPLRQGNKDVRKPQLPCCTVVAPLDFGAPLSPHAFPGKVQHGHRFRIRSGPERHKHVGAALLPLFYRFLCPSLFFLDRIWKFRSVLVSRRPNGLRIIILDGWTIKRYRRIWLEGVTYTSCFYFVYHAMHGVYCIYAR